MTTTHDVQKNWTEIQAKIKAKWSKFNDLELEGFRANLDKLSDQVQKSYGITKQQADTECSEFKKSVETLTTVPKVSAVVEESGTAPKSQAV